MKIGFTYDLRNDYLAEGYGEEETAEFDRPSTLDEIEGALNRLGYEVDRIGHARHLMERLVAGDRWPLVFNIAEGLRGFGRESQVPAILDVYDIPYTFTDPLASSMTLHKGMAKHVLRDRGVATTEFRVVSSLEEADAVDLAFPLFVKPVAEGTAKGIDGSSKVTSRQELRRACRRMLDEFHQPALVEPYLGGREFTVGITGTGDDAVAVGTLEIELLEQAEPHSYTYVNKERCEELCRFPLATIEWRAAAEPLALAAWKVLLCRDAGRVDLRADTEGNLYVMEVNPLPGLHPSHSDLPMLCTAVGIEYDELIDRIITSARQRIPASAKARPLAATGSDRR